jgi:hypothetical protein
VTSTKIDLRTTDSADKNEEEAASLAVITVKHKCRCVKQKLYRNILLSLTSAVLGISE